MAAYLVNCELHCHKYQNVKNNTIVEMTIQYLVNNNFIKQLH